MRRLIARGDHLNFFASEKVLGNTIISLRKDKAAGRLRVVLRTKKGTVKMEASLSDLRKVSNKTLIRDLAHNEGRHPNWVLSNIRLVPSPELQERLARYEKADVFKKYKFGVLLVKEGQTRDDEFFSNRK